VAQEHYQDSTCNHPHKKNATKNKTHRDVNRSLDRSLWAEPTTTSDWNDQAWSRAICARKPQNHSGRCLGGRKRGLEQMVVASQRLENRQRKESPWHGPVGTDGQRKKTSASRVRYQADGETDCPRCCSLNWVHELLSGRESHAD
jgi:hypothetical protein